jgi:hypothetical protein
MIDFKVNKKERKTIFDKYAPPAKQFFCFLLEEYSFFPLHTVFKRAEASRINLSLVHFLLYF